MGYILVAFASSAITFIIIGVLTANTRDELLSDNFELRQELENKEKIIEALHKKYNVNRKI